MMRILYWTELFWPDIGGVQVLATRLLPALLDRGYKVIVVTSHGTLDLPDEAQYKGIAIHRFPFLEALATRNLGQMMEVCKRLTKLKKEFKPNLVHVNFSDPTVFFHLRTAEAYPTPFLFTIRHALPNHATGHATLLGHALRAADWVTTCSKALLVEARQLVPEVSPHSSVIHDGLNMPALRPAFLPFDPPRILCLGRLVNEKGFEVALAAFASLVDRYPHVRLTIAGDGPARTELEQQAAALGLTDRVEFTGWVNPEQVPALMNTATAVVMPSRREGFGLVALEAALMARPVVATRVGGLPEVVVHEQTGLLVEKEDTKALAEAIAFLLEHPAAAGQMGQAARRRAAELFSLERHIDAHDALYRKLITEAVRVITREVLAPQ